MCARWKWETTTTTTTHPQAWLTVAEKARDWIVPLNSGLGCSHFFSIFLLPDLLNPAVAFLFRVAWRWNNS